MKVFGAFNAGSEGSQRIMSKHKNCIYNTHEGTWTADSII